MFSGRPKKYHYIIYKIVSIYYFYGQYNPALYYASDFHP